MQIYLQKVSPVMTNMEQFQNLDIQYQVNCKGQLPNEILAGGGGKNLMFNYLKGSYVDEKCTIYAFLTTLLNLL